ncbi:aminotransferase class IV [[Pseudomonas] carboxydohydrogena]|uniref:Probable branched-chain-amino-acid aminotransferase n=1 Tax=Afipia carboxydohydrogena TaxID=290 RepID=A0ABY8BUX4_AFICR|nr:aminotransferase class IV [[Pseudomonas] carboxydohydrogena]WEF52455.1 aminotransferase class IV [[Pseudomonas] carboxydohydrogena]
MTQVWLNGACLDGAEARLSISDRGFTLGDGIFETLLGIGERPVWLAEHLARLRAGASELGLHLAFDDRAIEAAVIGLLRRNGFARSAVRITLTRGPAAKRGLWVDDQSSPTLLMTCAPASVVSEPQRVVIARTTRRNEHSPLSRLKSLNYGDNILARREALARGAADALMLNGQGHVVCATVGNLFLRIAGEWITPPASDGILPGIARGKILSRMSVTQVSLSETDLRAADAGFISNSLGSVDIVEIEGVPLRPCLSGLPVAALYETE